MGTVIWLLAFAFPKAFQVIFRMMKDKGSEDEENLPSQKEQIRNEPSKKAEAKEETKQASVSQPP